MAGCGNCHTCGGKLRSVLDGEEWCDKCEAYRRYHSHGWGASGESSPCPKEPVSFNKAVAMDLMKTREEGSLDPKRSSPVDLVWSWLEKSDQKIEEK